MTDDTSRDGWQNSYSRRDQGWIHDRFIQEGGLGAFFPEAEPWIVERGMKLSDLQRAFGDAKNARMGIDNLVRVADYLASEARRREEAGRTETAAEFYHRAALCYLKAQWSRIDDDDPDKLDWHRRGSDAYDKVIEHSPHHAIERVEIDLPFTDTDMTGIFHRCGRMDAPTVIFVPGMDMIKEEFPNPLGNRFVTRGMNVLSIDGPGQGETRLRGVCDDEVDKYQRAGSAAIDWLADRPEVDPGRIGAFGVSMGSYWCPRIAHEDDRLAGIAVHMGCWYSRDRHFEQSQPFFKKRYMYMAGMYDEEEFDEFAREMTLDGLAGEIDTPTLITHGEYDDIQPREDAKRFYEELAGPKRLQLYKNQFHPVGQAGADVLCDVVDWLDRAFRGDVDDDLEEAVLVPDYPRADYVPSTEFEFVDQGDRYE